MGRGGEGEVVVGLDGGKGVVEGGGSREREGGVGLGWVKEGGKGRGGAGQEETG